MQNTEVIIGLVMAFYLSFLWMMTNYSTKGIVNRVEKAGSEYRFFGMKRTIDYPTEEQRRDSLIWGLFLLLSGLVVGVVGPIYLSQDEIVVFFARVAGLILVFQMGLARLLTFRLGSLGYAFGFLFSAVLLHAHILSSTSPLLNNDYSRGLVLVYLVFTAYALSRGIIIFRHKQGYSTTQTPHSDNITQAILVILSAIIAIVEFFNIMYGLLRVQ